MKCIKCNKEIDKDSKFCIYCGNIIKKPHSEKEVDKKTVRKTPIKVASTKKNSISKINFVFIGLSIVLVISIVIILIFYISANKNLTESLHTVEVEAKDFENEITLKDIELREAQLIINSSKSEFDKIEIELNNKTKELDNIKRISKDIAINSCRFILYNNDGLEPIKNIYGNVLYNIRFKGWSINEDSPNEDKFSNVHISISAGPDLILYAGSDLIYLDTGRSAISTDKNDYPNAIIDVVNKGEYYIITEDNRYFLVLVESCNKAGGGWFNTLEVSIFLLQ